MHKASLLFLALLAPIANAQPITEALVKPIGFPSVRGPLNPDPMQRLIVEGQWTMPTEGGGWKRVKAGADGTFSGDDFRGTYVSTSVESATDRVAMLHAAGHSAVYVNGVPRGGEPYGYGYLALPVRLKKGSNELLFVAGRGQLKAEVKDLVKPFFINPQDATLPDIVYGEKGPLWAGLVVVNGQEASADHLSIRTSVNGKNSIETDLPTIQPLTIRKVPLRFAIPGGSLPDRLTYKVQLLNRGKEVDSFETEIAVRKPNETYKRTFISGIDGSVQYYAVNPAQRPHSQNALIFSVHGAGVEAPNQANSYAPKDWATVVAPTNRRPFGFDWEDWGRLDLLEVVGHASAKYPHAADRVLLTGHSMGGHGTWINGAMFPGKWAAVAPSAGWISFWSYAGAWEPKDPTPVESMFRRAMNVSDTLMFGRNLKAAPIYILHGDADDNVPVEQARNMRKYLQDLGVEPGYHEEPGAGHWWDKEGPGAECLDWPALMTLFNDARIPSHPIALDFTTVNPAVSATDHWLTIVQQERSLLPSSVTFQPPANNVIRGTTLNVRRIRINDPAPQLWGLTLELDGQPVPIPTTLHNPVHLIKSAGKWVVTKPANPDEKSPERGGPFRNAFANNVVLVYGTSGLPEENEWAYNKARYDAETFYYRANGAMEIISDRQFRASSYKDRNVVLYGNADTNSAWSGLLGDSPIQVSRGLIRMGTKPLAGPNLAACFIRPRKGSKTALVGAVSGTGLAGMNLTTRLPFFLSGAAFPDWFVLDPSFLTEGSKAAVGAGFFDNDWSLVDQDSAWKG